MRKEGDAATSRYSIDMAKHAPIRATYKKLTRPQGQPVGAPRIAPGSRCWG
jgi:hypothetical protein